MLPANLDDLTPEHIQDLIDSEVAEGLTLEYKEQLPTDSSDDKRKFLYRVSGMANAAGGEMIFGIVDKDGPDGQNTGVAEKLSGMRIPNPQKAIEPLANLIRDGIAPRLFGVKMQIVNCPTGDVLVIRIPQSWNKPHMVTIGQVNKFYIRTAIGSSPMSIDEIRRAFSEQGELREIITRWRKHRLELIEAGRGPVPLAAGAITLFHVIPVEAFTPGSYTSAWRIDEQDKMKVYVPGSANYSHRYNADGFICHSGIYRGEESANLQAYTQLFRSGIIEYGFSHEYQPEWAKSPLIRGLALEQEMVFCYDDAYSRFRREGNVGSIYVGFSMTGIEGRIIHINQLEWNGREERIRQNSFSSPEVYVDLTEPEDTRPFHKVLRPLVDMLWQVGGREGTPFHSNGKWNPFGNYYL